MKLMCESLGTSLTGECPREMRFDASRGICVPTEQPQRDYGAEFQAQAVVLTLTAL